MKRIALTIFVFLSFVLACGPGTNLPGGNTGDNQGFVLREQIPLPLALPMGLVTGNDNYFYTALKGQGVSVYERGSTVRKVASVGVSQLENLHAMHLEKRGNYLYIALGDFFGRGAKAGLAIIDVSNPNSPNVTDVWTTSEKKKGSAIVKVEGNYAYLGAMSEGVYVFNISNKSNIRLHSTYQPDVNFPTPDPNAVGHPNARGMDIVGNMMYLCYDAGGIRVIDISDEKNLREIGRYINTAPGLKQQAYNNVVVNGNYAYAAVDYCGLEILDISDPGEIRRVGWWNPWKCNTLANTWFNSNGHTNQLYLDNAKKQIYLSSGKSELNLIDVSNPRAPKELGSYGAKDNKQATWGLTVNGDDVYLLYITSVVPFQANWAGIRIVQRSDR